MKTYKQLISELSLTKLVRYRSAAQKHLNKLYSKDYEDAVSNDKFLRVPRPKPYKQHPDFPDSTEKYMKIAGTHMARQRIRGIDTATKKINQKMRVSKLH